MILAFNKSAIVSGTSSYNLSSTAVAPIRYKSFSILLANSSLSYSLFSDDANASFYLSNARYSYSDKIFIAINKVLNPIELNSDNLF